MSHAIDWGGGDGRARVLPLMLTLLLHVLLIGGWLVAARAKPASGARPGAERVVMLLFAAPAKSAPKRRAAPAVPPLKPPPKKRARIEATLPAHKPTAIPIPTQAEARPPERAQAAPAAPAAEIDELRIKPTPGPTLVVERALRDVGRIDRALRAGKSGVPANRPDTPVARFERLMAGAYIDRSSALGIDTYSSPDGVSYTRLTRGGRAVCYMGGKARPREVNCPPPDSGWVKK